MKIGIDIDGVLTDISRFYLDYGAKYAFENNIDKIAEPNGYEIEEILDLGKDAHIEFWKKYDEFYTKKIYTREFAAEVIAKLKNDNHEIHLITARKIKEEAWTKDWLKENNIYYDVLTFAEEKVDYCKNHNIDIMIEDNTNNILTISKLIPVICVDNRYNQDCEGDNITRCYSWYDIYSKIKIISNRKEN